VSGCRTAAWLQVEGPCGALSLQFGTARETGGAGAGDRGRRLSPLCSSLLSGPSLPGFTHTMTRHLATFNSTTLPQPFPCWDLGSPDLRLQRLARCSPLARRPWVGLACTLPLRAPLTMRYRCGSLPPLLLGINSGSLEPKPPPIQVVLHRNQPTACPSPIGGWGPSRRERLSTACKWALARSRKCVY